MTDDELDRAMSELDYFVWPPMSDDQKYPDMNPVYASWHSMDGRNVNTLAAHASESEARAAMRSAALAHLGPIVDALRARSR
ncbi:MAG TPA: hypothetical protein VGL61_06515 [Kofleriaceae bacterium]|jgi:hypothetical protein